MSEPGGLIRSRSGRTAAPNFHSFVISEIGVGIVAGRFAVGSILPRDADLMELYDVSRTVLREALKTLEAKGLVEARPKVGTRVSPRSRWALLDQQVLAWHFEAGLNPVFLGQAFDLRQLVERDAGRLAARLRTADHIRMMYYWVQQMSVSRGVPESFALATLEMHRVMVEASQNPLLRATLGLVEFTIAAAMPETEGAGAYYDAAISAQRGLVQTIEAGNLAVLEEGIDAAISADRESALDNLRLRAPLKSA